MVTKFKHIRRLIFLSQYVHYALKRNIPKSGSPLHAKVPQFIKNNKKNNICNGSCHSIGQMAQVNKGGIEIYFKTMIIITAYSHMAYSDCLWNMFDKKKLANSNGIEIWSDLSDAPHRHCHGKIVFPIHDQQWHVHRQWHIMRTKYINE